MSETNERSVASTGSVEPVAWAALRDDGDIAWIGYTPEGAADGACGRQIVPLYRSPTLTDAEREILPVIAKTIRGRGWTDWAETIDGLLERMKPGEK